MKTLLLLLVVLISNEAYGADVFSLREFYLIHKKFGEGSRNPLIDEEVIENRQIDREVSLHWNVDILKNCYWDNQILSYTDRFKDSQETDQFRLVGWHFQMGLRLTSFIDVGYDHFSKHLLDSKYPQSRFPVEDSMYIRVDFYERDDRGGLFW
jgi:hypothetical protein